MQERTEEEAQEGEAEGLETEIVNRRGNLGGGMAGRQLIHSARGPGREITIWEKTMFRSSGLLCALPH